MKLTGKKVDEFILNPFSGGIKSVLIYGNDESLIDFRAKKIIGSFRKLSYGIDIIDLKVDKFSKVVDLINSIDFFLAGKLIIINSLTDKFLSELETLLTNLDNKVRIICHSNDIAKCPKIRGFFEKTGKNVASIGCYEIEIGERISIVSSFFRENGIKFEDERLINELIERIGCNVFDLENELEKILILTSESKLFKTEDLDSITNINEKALNNLIDAFFLKKVNDVNNAISSAIENEVNSVLIIRSLQKYCNKILNSIINIKNGSSRESEGNANGIFFKKLDLFYKHLNLWQISELENLIERLYFLDSKTRENSSLIQCGLASLLFI